MGKEQFTRSVGLLGEEGFKALKEKTILVAGLGGVGGTALEALVRTGVQHLIIIDFDKVDAANLNRQIIYLKKDIGKKKTAIAKDRILAINPDAKVTAIDKKIEEDIGELLSDYKIDFIIDAIDDINGKINLIKFAIKKDIPIIVSLGMANRFNPNELTIMRLDKTTQDPLAKKLRYEMKKAGLSTSKLYTVISKEIPMRDGNKLNSIMTVPSAAGLTIAYYVIDKIIHEED